MEATLIAEKPGVSIKEKEIIKYAYDFQGCSEEVAKQYHFNVRKIQTGKSQRMIFNNQKLIFFEVI